MRRTLVAAVMALSGLSGCALFVRETNPLVATEPSEPLRPASRVASEQPLNDEAILLAVRRQLSRELGAVTAAIDVTVEQGIVHLTGSVPQGLAWIRAVESSEAVRGVRAVVNQLRVQPVKVADGEIQSMLQQELRGDSLLSPAQIDVGVSEARVTLDGSVQSYTQQQVAERHAWAIRGVRGVENRLRVSPKDARNDDEVAADVRRRLAIDAYLEGRPIRVAVHDGAVALVGEVKSAFEKRRALRDGWVEGARDVDVSRVIVERSRPPNARSEVRSFPSDVEVRRAVRDALRFDPRVWHVPISVDVAGRTVTLSGNVPTWEMRAIAERDAANTVGAWRVDNRLAVIPTMAANDQELEQRVLNTLARYPRGEREVVTARVRDGTVLLEGRVDSRYVSSHLQEAVGRVHGVKKVDNDLSVSAPLRALRDDAMLERDIETELWWDPRVDHSNVAVEVRDGVAILTGVVEDQQAYDAVVENVLEAEPRGIENHLRRPVAGMP